MNYTKKIAAMRLTSALVRFSFRRRVGATSVCADRSVAGVAVASGLSARSRSLRTSLRLSRLDNLLRSACHASASTTGCVRNLSYGAESSVFLTRATPPLRRFTPRRYAFKRRGVKVRRSGRWPHERLFDGLAWLATPRFTSVRHRRSAKALREIHLKYAMPGGPSKNGSGGQRTRRQPYATATPAPE